MSATDKDSGGNGEIIYRLTNGSRDHFSIDSTLGVIRVARAGEIDYDKYRKYVITVRINMAATSKRFVKI